MARLARFLLAAWLLVPAPAFAQADAGPGGDEDGDAPGASDLSASDTAFAGARLLRYGEQFTVGGIEVTDPADAAEDEVEAEIYAHGDTVFADIVSHRTGNRVGLVLEAFWFMSSLDRDSDSFVLVVKQNTSPDVGSDWGLLTDDVAQSLVATAVPGGEFGSVRWDWSIPFQTYRWEPSRVTEIEQQYSIGGSIGASGAVGAQGSILKDITGNVNVQAKGEVSASHRATTRYTITLYRWEMRVSTAATQMEWGLIPLDPEKSTDNAYHEYFVVLQGDRGSTVGLESLEFGGEFRNYVPFWFDDYEWLYALVANLRLEAPPEDELCEEGEMLEGSECVPVEEEEPDAGPGCQVNSDCDTGTYCSGGECVYDCAEDGDCGSGETCDDRGRCVFQGECESAVDCAEGQYCSLGVCVDELGTDDPGVGAVEGGCSVAGEGGGGLAVGFLVLALAGFRRRRAA